jgi:hypothetical protein
MRTRLIRALYALLVVLAVAYGYDYAHLLAIPQKGNKVEYALDAQSPMESDPCVHSLFPHYGYAPCWYIVRKSKSPTQMLILAPEFLLRFIGRP